MPIKPFKILFMKPKWWFLSLLWCLNRKQLIIKWFYFCKNIKTEKYFQQIYIYIHKIVSISLQCYHWSDPHGNFIGNLNLFCKYSQSDLDWYWSKRIYWGIYYKYALNSSFYPTKLFYFIPHIFSNSSFCHAISNI